MIIKFNNKTLELDQNPALKLKISLQVSLKSYEFKDICLELTKYGLGEYENNYELNVTETQYNYIYQIYQKIL